MITTPSWADTSTCWSSFVETTFAGCVAMRPRIEVSSRRGSSVVAQRIYLDHYRNKYGRSHAVEAESPAHEEERAARRRLVDLIGAELDLESVIDSHGRTPEDSLCEEEIHRALGVALRSLTPSARLLIKLRFEDGLGIAEIASSLGLPTRFHAYRRLVQALADLRQALEKIVVREASP